MSAVIPFNPLFEDGPLYINPADKVLIIFKPAGNAAILTHDRVKVSLSKSFSAIKTHLRKLLQIQADVPLYCYIQQAFEPDNNDFIFDLHNNYGTEAGLTINYALEPLWG